VLWSHPVQIICRLCETYRCPGLTAALLYKDPATGLLMDPSLDFQKDTLHTTNTTHSLSQPLEDVFHYQTPLAR